jgi:hypothetical protein
MYSKIPISFVKTIILTFNFKFKLTRQQSKMSQIRLNTKIAIVAQGGDDGDGHSGLSQQPTMKLTTMIDTMVLKMSAY